MNNASQALIAEEALAWAICFFMARRPEECPLEMFDKQDLSFCDFNGESCSGDKLTCWKRYFRFMARMRMACGDVPQLPHRFPANDIAIGRSFIRKGEAV
jgi:hypothetical protein